MPKNAQKYNHKEIMRGCHGLIKGSEEIFFLHIKINVSLRQESDSAPRRTK